MFTLRIRLIALLLFLAFFSLLIGILAAQWQAAGGSAWPFVAAVLLLDGLGLYLLHRGVLLPLQRNLHRHELAEAALRRYAAEVEDLYNRAPCGYHSLDAEGKFLRINDTALAWLGYCRDEVLGRPIRDFLTPAGQRLFDTSFEEFKASGSAHDLEQQFLRKDGSILYVLLNAVAVRDAQGRFLATRTAFVDLSERRKSEEQLAELSMRLQAVLDAATEVAIIATDLEGRITLFNVGAERMLGYRAEELLGRETPWKIHLPAEVEAHGQRLGEELGRSLAGFDVFVERARRGGHEEREWTYVRKDGSRLTVNLVVTALHNAAGDVTGFLGIATDVTEKRRAAEELRQAKEAAEAANRAKSDFLASMSHEIRTPLAAIVGMVELLQQGAANPEQHARLQTLGTAAESLLSLISNILDISKIEAGKLELEARPFSPRALVSDVVGVLAVPAQRKGLALHTQVEPEVPGHVIGDAGRLRQVLVNLVGNAIKFTQQGEVVVSVGPASGGRKPPESASPESASPESASPESASPESAPSERQAATQGAYAPRSPEVTLLFSVKDTGIGIPPDKLQRIFQPFEQADESTTRRFGGTGLGLTISARLIELMGGRLDVRSEVGKGSTFSFQVRLPVVAEGAVAPAPVPGPQPEQAGPGLRILLAEDNAVNQQVLSLMLGKAGHQVRVAQTGREALAALEQGPFDLVLMDVQMPEMDGLRCTRLIRAREKAVGGHVPIVAVTANALQGERQRCLQAGMDDYLTKPVRSQELHAVIARLCSRADRAPGPTSFPAAGGEPGPAWLPSLRQMGFDDQAVAGLVRTFLEMVPGRMESLARAVADRDAAGVAQAAHKIKGSLMVFSVGPAVEAAALLERLAGEGQLDALPAALAALQQTIGPLVEAMTTSLHGR